VLPNWIVVLTALVYLTALFAIAHVGDNRGRLLMSGRLRPAIYALTLGVYCTSWTFLGSVGLSSRTGYDFLPIYLGPILVMSLGAFFIGRIVSLAKAHNIVSIGDFVASRYGKSQAVAAAVTLIAVIGVLPYVALQLKAISTSLEVFLASGTPRGMATAQTAPIFGDISLLIALILAFFAIIFGTRNVDSTEHQDGLMMAVAVESAVKLAAFLCAGIFVVWFLFDGPTDLWAKAASRPDVVAVFSRTPDWSLMFTMTLLSAGAILLLPRQFHVMVIENRDLGDIRKAAWLFPLYLVAINLFVIPLAVAGLLLFPGNDIDRDLTVLAVPLKEQAGFIALFVLIGGLSAATAMVIVECVALSIMISNEIFMPLALRRRGASFANMGATILLVRRVAIVLVLLLGYSYYRASGDAALAAIGLLAFAAIAQIGPAFIGGLIWRRANAQGAVAGLLTGLSVWAYTLLIPSFGKDNAWFGAIIQYGLFGVDWLKPSSLFGVSAHPLVHGVMASLLANTAAFVIGSLARSPSSIERAQADLFIAADDTSASSGFRLWRAAITNGELKQAVSRYLGLERTDAAFASFSATSGVQVDPRQMADPQAMRFAEHLLASGIGASSSRLVMTMLLKRRSPESDPALKVLDEAAGVIQENRALLQHALDHAQQGLTVFDSDLKLRACNHAFQAIFDLPDRLVQPGAELAEIVAHNAQRGLYGDVDNTLVVSQRLNSYLSDTEPVRLRLPARGLVIDIRSNPLPDGGRVTTYTDITETVAAEEALEKANETLEKRVQERTEELTSVNAALSRAKAEADEANVSKTRFLAAASHDILQPLNAARLYTSSLVERVTDSETGALVKNADASLDAVEEIITALLDISRLDSGAMKPEIGSVSINDLFRQLAIEFGPMARERGLPLTFIPTALHVRSDRRLLRRLLQNLVSNALKYTPRGRVLVGCRRTKGKLRIEVWDTGIGIPVNRQKLVFREFQRLDQGALIARGLGLGLSIVERIARVLEHKLTLQSLSGKGTVFTLELPLAPALAVVASTPQTAPSARNLTGLTVLCIDNEPAILDGMRSLLESWDCTTLTAPSAKQATLMIKQTSIDAVIADFHLDQGDGLAAIKAIRRVAGAETNAILLTADRTLELRERAAEISVQVFNKPVKPAALRVWLAQLKVHRSAAE
jgi:Na+/proline symporter/signal transduction histidine kinase